MGQDSVVFLLGDFAFGIQMPVTWPTRFHEVLSFVVKLCQELSLRKVGTWCDIHKNYVEVLERN
jgi:hypothetical protein